MSIDGEYSGKIFDTDLSVVPGDLYTMALTRPRVTCRRYTQYVWWLSLTIGLYQELTIHIDNLWTHAEIPPRICQGITDEEVNARECNRYDSIL